jgi:hypothetical protein
MQVNQLRGLYGWRDVSQDAWLGWPNPRTHGGAGGCVAGAAMVSLQDQLQRIDALEQDVDRPGAADRAWLKQEGVPRDAEAWHQQVHRDALVATMGDAKTFSLGVSLLRFRIGATTKRYRGKIDWTISKRAIRTCARC